MSQYWPFSGLTRYGALRERLIVSLDLGSQREALKMVDQLGRLVGIADLPPERSRSFHVITSIQTVVIGKV
jgi:hypothetical protein